MTAADANRPDGTTAPPAPPAPPAPHSAGAVAGRGADSAADLPAPLANLVHETARRTRLRRAERNSVAAELAAHLRDGLAAGRSAEALAADFGRPSVVAPLIRRATLAKRGALDRTLHRLLKWGSISVACLLGAYLLAALRLWWLAPTIRFDPIERLNAMLPTAEGEPAWPLYKEGLFWHKAIRNERAALATLPGATPEQIAQAGVEPGASLLPRRPDSSAPAGGGDSAASEAAHRAADAALFREHQDEIAKLRKAAGRPVLGFPMGTEFPPGDAAYFAVGVPAVVPPQLESTAPPEFPALSILLPQLAELRRAARLLAADAWLAIEDGDGQRAAADLAAMLGVASHAEENRTLVGQLVGTAIRAMASQQIRMAVARRPAAFGEADLALLAAALSAVPASAYQVDTSVERLAFADSVQRLYTDDGSGDGVLLARSVERLSELVQPVATIVAPARGGGARGTAPPSGTHPVSTSAPGGGGVIETPAQLESALTFLTGPAAALIDPGRRAAIEAHTRLMDAVEQESRLAPWDPKSGEAVWAVEQELFGGRGSLGGTGLLPPSQTSVVVRMLGPAISRAAFERRQSRWWIAAAQIAVALERYRQARGEWPATLDALVPAFLPAVPRDPFDGAPLRYELRQGRPIVWSIGNDRIDEHGEPAREQDGTPDPERAARWKGGSAKPIGFVDPRSGNFIERERDGEGDWVMWAPQE